MAKKSIKKFDKDKKQDLVILLTLNFLAVVISLLTNAPFLVSTVLFLGVPAFYLISKGQVNLTKIGIGTLVLGGLYSFSFDFLAEYNNAWNWNGGLLFSAKIMDVVQPDVLVWFFLWVLYLLTFYEHFIDDEKIKRISRRLPLTMGVGIVALFSIIAAYNLKPSVLEIPYAYLVLCLIILGTFLMVGIKKPSLVKKAAPITVFFFIVYLSHELTSLYLEQWTFPGQYIGWVSLWTVRFPVEELIFWVVSSSLIGVVYYEASIDDLR